MVTLACRYRSRLQIDGPYDKAFLEKLQKCPAEDDGSIEYAVAKVTITHHHAFEDVRLKCVEHF